MSEQVSDIEEICHRWTDNGILAREGYPASLKAYSHVMALLAEVDRLREELNEERITVLKFQQEVGVDQLGLHGNCGPDEVAEEVERLRAEEKGLRAEVVLLRDGYNVRPMTETESNLMTQVLELRRERAELRAEVKRLQANSSDPLDPPPRP